MTERFVSRHPGVAAVRIGVATAAILAGCTSGPGALPVAPTAAPSDPQTAAKPGARAACPNYAKAFSESTYPRDAIARGLTYGKVVVRFVVDGSTISILSVDATDPAFAATATGIVLRFECHSDRPTEFEVPFTFRRER